jgi:regulator of protease activity HflC (stomatin/prohibitin superfamily)
VKSRLALFVILAACSLNVGCSYETVQPGYVGVFVPLYGSKADKTDYETVYGRVWYNPWYNTVYVFPTYMQQVVWSKDDADGNPGDQSITFNTSEGKSINCDIAFAYSIKEEAVPKIFREQRREIKEITHGYLRNKVRDAFVQYAGKAQVHEIMGQGKEAFLQEVKADLIKELEPKGYLIDMVSIVGEMRVDAKVTEAISNTIAQQQKAIEAEAKVKQSEAEGRQAVAVAKGKADAERAEAEGKAAAKLKVAEAEAKANKLLQESLSEELLKYEAMKTWDGKLPTFMGGNAPVPFVNVGK